MDLNTQYLGLNLKNPVIAASSGLTDSVESIKELEKAGVSAVVLKSLFEEEIYLEMKQVEKEASKFDTTGWEHLDYFDASIKQNNLTNYTAFIKNVKQEVDIPVIASINCLYSHEWVYFADRLEEAGADALELNMFFLPTDLKRSTAEQEKMYFSIIEKVLAKVSIPVSLKISHYFADLGAIVQKLSLTGIKGIVMFNRYFEPDFDIENMRVTSGNVLSSSSDLSTSLRWVSIMANRVHCDLAATTGVHKGQDVIKQILAGAKAVQIASTLYQNGNQVVGDMLTTIENWMNRKGFKTLDDFRAKMSQSESDDPALYERVQFMKYFSNK